MQEWGSARQPETPRPIACGLRRLLGAVAIAGLLASGAAAQTADPAADPVSRAELDRLFDEVLRDPANLQLTLRYARVATQLGDYEAAITALERVLFFNPALGRARLELGVLYYRLGSFAMARSYLDEARQQTLPPDAAALVERYLAEIAKQQSPHQFTALVGTGFQWSSNANLGPTSSAIRLNAPFLGVVSADLSSQFTKRSDTNFFLTGSGLYAYDLGNEDRTTLEVTGQGYVADYFDVNEFDLFYGETTVGLRTTFATWGLTGFSAKPYLIADYVRLGGEPFYHAFGAGFEAAQAVTPDLVVKGIFELRDKRYADPASRVSASELSGIETIYGGQVTYALARNQLLLATLSYSNQNAREDYQSYAQYGVSAGYQILYPAPFGLGAGPWQTSFSAGRIVYDYDAPNPVVDPGETRFDKRWRFAVGQSVPLTERISLLLQVQREIVSSNIPNFEYNNTSVLVGPQFRF